MVFREELRRCKGWSDDELTSRLSEAPKEERRSLTALLVRLAEFDRRGLDLAKGYPNIYEYCMRVLKHSRSGAARRIAAARAGRKYRSVLAMIETGDLSLVAAAMLWPHLKPHNRRRLLRRARGKTQDDVARLVAEIAPEIPRRDSIRVIAARASADDGLSPASAVPASGSAPPGGELLILDPSTATGREEPPEAVYSATLALTHETYMMLLRARELLRHRIPGGEFDPILRLSLKKLLGEIDRDLKRPRSGRVMKPAGGRRARPAAGRRPSEGTKQEAWDRDGGQCTFVGTDGVRCGSRAWLEFDHVKPFALGGTSEAANLRPMCRPHNQLLGRQTFGGGKPN